MNQNTFEDNANHKDNHELDATYFEGNKIIRYDEFPEQAQREIEGFRDYILHKYNLKPGE